MTKIIGLGLLILGVLIIVWGLWSSYQIFNGSRDVPEIFAMPEEQAGGTNISGTQVEEQVRQMLGDQISKLIPAGSMPKMLNLIAWSIFMFILIYAGGKISGIGIKLLRSEKEKG